MTSEESRQDKGEKRDGRKDRGPLRTPRKPRSDKGVKRQPLTREEIEAKRDAYWENRWRRRS